MKKQAILMVFLIGLSGQMQAKGLGDILGGILKQVQIAGFSLDTLKANFSELTNIDDVLKKSQEELTKGFDAQLKELLNQQQLMKGSFNLSKLFDNPELRKWQHAGQSWTDLTNISKGINDPLGKLTKELVDKYPIKKAQEVFTKATPKEQAELYDEMAKTAIAMSAQSKLSYNSIDSELKILEQLQDEIDKSGDSQKKILDLIARVSIENAKINAYRIKNEAMQSQVSSMGMQQQVNDTKWASDFLKWN